MESKRNDLGREKRGSSTSAKGLEKEIPKRGAEGDPKQTCFLWHREDEEEEREGRWKPDASLGPRVEQLESNEQCGAAISQLAKLQADYFPSFPFPSLLAE